MADETNQPQRQKAKRRTMTPAERDEERQRRATAPAKPPDQSPARSAESQDRSQDAASSRAADSNADDASADTRFPESESSAMSEGEEIARVNPDVASEAPGRDQGRVYRGFTENRERPD